MTDVRGKNAHVLRSQDVSPRVTARRGLCYSGLTVCSEALKTDNDVGDTESIQCQQTEK